MMIIPQIVSKQNKMVMRFYMIQINILLAVMGNSNFVNFETINYNKTFLSALALLGVYTSTKLICQGAKYLRKIRYRSFTREEFDKRYGEDTWGVITDVEFNEEYCMYLANMGVNLILCGDLSQDISLERIRNKVTFIFPNCKIISIMFKEADRQSPNFYEQVFKDKIQDLDISFLVLPNLESQKHEELMATHEQQVQPFLHYYSLLKGFVQLFTSRAERGIKSAIILPSLRGIDRIEESMGIYVARKSGIDALVRSLSYEEGEKIDFVCSRGSVPSCFKVLGKQLISE